MRRTLLIGLCITFAVSAAATAQSPSMPDEDIRSLETPLALPPVIEDWLPPSWWRPIDIVYGPLDDDGFEDMVACHPHRGHLSGELLIALR